jgi:hypothetical protein
MRMEGPIQALTNHVPPPKILQLCNRYKRVLARTRAREIRKLINTDQSKALQAEILKTIEAVETVLSGSLLEGHEQVIVRAKRMATRFIAEVGPLGDVTPRHADGTQPPLAINFCHFVPLAWLESSITLKSQFVFPAGRCANVADGPMVSMCSINHRTEGWLMVQLQHAMMKHLTGQALLAGFSGGFMRYGPHTQLGLVCRGCKGTELGAFKCGLRCSLTLQQTYVK